MTDDQPINLAHHIVTTGAATRDTAVAIEAITPALVELQRQLEKAAGSFLGPPRLCGYNPPPPCRGESPSRTADRVRHAIRSLHCAKCFGSADDVRRVIEATVRDVKIAAVGHVGMTRAKT